MYRGVRLFLGANTFMKILLVEHHSNEITKWRDIISLLFPLANRHFCSIDTWSGLSDKEQVDFVLIFSYSVDDSILELVSHYINLEVPVLCVINDYSKLDYDLLLDKKLNGLIQEDSTSVKAMKEIIELLLEGGYYLQAPVKKAKRITVF